jgi:hypothetical protein
LAELMVFSFVSPIGRHSINIFEKSTDRRCR